MKWLNYLSNTGAAINKRFSKVETRVSNIECFGKLKSYTTTEMNAITNPEVGFTIFNTTADAPYVYKSGGWAAV
jgi:hypothetical protein